MQSCTDVREKGTTMSSDGQPQEQSEEAPTSEELEEPSTEKAPGEEPRGGEPQDSGKKGESEPSHQAVGIGVIGAPLVDDEAAG